MPFKKGKSGNSKGRPKGSTTKPKITDYMTKEEIEEVVSQAKEAAKNGDTRMMMYLMDQYFGKAMQRHEVGGEDGGAIIFNIASEIHQKHAAPPKATGSS